MTVKKRLFIMAFAGVAVGGFLAKDFIMDKIGCSSCNKNTQGSYDSVDKQEVVLKEISKRMEKSQDIGEQRVIDDYFQDLIGQGDLEAIEILMKKKYSPSPQVMGTVLLNGAKNQDDKVLKLTLVHGLQVGEENITYAFYEFARLGDVKKMEWLLEENLIPSQDAIDEVYVLCSSKGLLPVMEWMLSKKLRPSDEGVFKSFAACSKNATVTKFLLEKGLKPKQTQIDSLCDQALVDENLDFINIFLAKGIKPSKTVMFRIRNYVKSISGKEKSKEAGKILNSFWAEE